MGEIVLGRVGHYHVPNSGDGYCQTALVTDATPAEAGDIGDPVPAINVVAWSHQGDPTPHIGVPVASPPEGDQVAASFHLTRDCPWGR